MAKSREEVVGIVRRDVASGKITTDQAKLVLDTWAEKQQKPEPEPLDVDVTNPYEVQEAIMAAQGYSKGEAKVMSNLQDWGNIGLGLAKLPFQLLTSPVQTAKAVLTPPVSMMEKSLVQAPVEAVGGSYDPYTKAASDAEGERLYQTYVGPQGDRLLDAMQWKSGSTLLEMGGALGGLAKGLTTIAKGGKAAKASKAIQALDAVTNVPVTSQAWLAKKMLKGGYTSLKDRLKDSSKLKTAKTFIGGTAADYIRDMGSVLTQSDIYKATKKHITPWTDFARKHNERIKGGIIEQAEELHKIGDEAAYKLQYILDQDTAGGFVGSTGTRQLLVAMREKITPLVERAKKDPTYELTPGTVAEIRWLRHMLKRKPGTRYKRTRKEGFEGAPSQNPAGPSGTVGDIPVDMNLELGAAPGQASLPPSSAAGGPMPQSSQFDTLLPGPTKANMSRLFDDMQKLAAERSFSSVAIERVRQIRREIDLLDGEHKVKAQQMYDSIMGERPITQKLIEEAADNAARDEYVFTPLDHTLAKYEPAQSKSQAIAMWDDMATGVRYKDTVNATGRSGKKTVDYDVKTSSTDPMFTLSEINEVKRRFNRSTANPFKDDPTKKADVMEQETMKWYSRAADDLENYASEKGITEVKELNREVQAAKTYANIMERRGNIKHKNFLGFTDLMVINAIENDLAGGITGAVSGGAGIIMLRRMIESSKVKTALARQMSRLHPDYQKAITNSMETGKLTGKAQKGLTTAFNLVKNDVMKMVLVEYLENTKKETKEKTEAKIRRLRAKKREPKTSLSPREFYERAAKGVPTIKQTGSLPSAR